VGLIRNPAQVADVQETGAEAVVCDLEAASADDVAGLLAGAAAVVFAAGAGAGSGAPRKDSVDRGASVLLAETAAEDDLRSRDLDWTILRPSRLTDAPATGRVRLAAPPVPPGSISRADVAAVIAALLDEPGTRHQTLELVGGDTPPAAAVRRT
jgi:nucleoside-diphosphate-sugar epimerase